MRTRNSDHLSNERAPLCRTAPSPCNSTAAEAPPRALASQSRRGIDQSQPTTPCSVHVDYGFVSFSHPCPRKKGGRDLSLSTQGFTTLPSTGEYNNNKKRANIRAGDRRRWNSYRRPSFPVSDDALFLFLYILLSQHENKTGAIFSTPPSSPREFIPHSYRD